MNGICPSMASNQTAVRQRVARHKSAKSSICTCMTPLYVRLTLRGQVHARPMQQGLRTLRLGRLRSFLWPLGSVSAMDSTDSERCRSASEKGPSPTNCTVLFCHGSSMNALSLNLRARTRRGVQRFTEWGA